MEKELLVFRYDRQSDSLVDQNGVTVLMGYSGMGLTPFEQIDSKKKFKQVKELVEAGVKPDEIIDMKKAGVL